MSYVIRTDIHITCTHRGSFHRVLCSQFSSRICQHARSSQRYATDDGRRGRAGHIIVTSMIYEVWEGGTNKRKKCVDFHGLMQSTVSRTEGALSVDVPRKTGTAGKLMAKCNSIRVTRIEKKIYIVTRAHLTSLTSRLS